MSINITKGARPVLLAVTFTVGATAWLITRPDSSSVEIPFPIDAMIDAVLADAAPDSAIDAPAEPPPTDWTMVTIHGPESAVGLDGADGVDLAMIDGKMTIISPWEQSGAVSVSTLDGGVWSTISLATVVNVEDAKFCDVDEDGDLDIIAAGQGKRIRVWFGPHPYSTTIEIGAATNLQAWMQLGCSPGRVWAGGRGAGASVGYFTSATPRTASSWTHHHIANVDWLMSLVVGDFDGDSDLDVLISDRLNGQLNKGSTWFRDDGGGTWTKFRIHASNNEGDPKFLELSGGNTVIVGMSSSTKPNLLKKSVTADNWATWTTTTITPYPSNVGQYQGVATRTMDGSPCDLTGDGIAEVVLTHSAATGSLSGVVAIDGATGARIEIDHGAGEKYDDLICIDMDGDGDLDILTSEQNTGLGVVWFKNPRLHL
jgi:hypothetical protein